MENIENNVAKVCAVLLMLSCMVVLQERSGAAVHTNASTR